MYMDRDRSSEDVSTINHPDWRPFILESAQNDLLITLTELILPATETPGAQAAHVNRYMDLLLRDAPARDRLGFVHGLASVDSIAMREYGRSFVDCSHEEQTAMLLALDTADDQFFRLLKKYTVRIYYATAIGHEELNR
jgi:hypothetical protein